MIKEVKLHSTLHVIFFRNGKPWGRYKCLGSCKASFSGSHSSTAGFKHATSSCTAAGSSWRNTDILNGYNIGFWCDYGYRNGNWDGSVLMIGGGGTSCDGADHGIGITEDNVLSFDIDRHDFGNNAMDRQQSAYALNLWVR